MFFHSLPGKTTVTPLAGVGIEMKPSWEELMKDPVTPLAGVGIEIL